MTSWKLVFFVLSNMERGFENFCEMISDKVSEKGSCVCPWEIIGREGRMNKVDNLLSEEFCLFQKVSIRPGFEPGRAIASIRHCN